jgi:PKD repeat protein
VTEIVSGAGGSSTDTVANYITVLPPPPVASFMATPTSGAAPLSVGFTDQSSGSITGWAWAFGDGNTSMSQSPSNIYANPGSYTVQEIVSGLGGSSTDTVSNLISVYDRFVWWQQAYSLSGTLTGGNASYTGDGMSNTNKFMAGFNPTNPAAYLHVISVAKSGANITVTYLGASGDTTYPGGPSDRTNILEYTYGTGNGSFTSTNFTGAVTNFLGVDYNSVNGGTGLGTVTNMTDTIPSTPTNRYYRVRVLLP